MARYDKYEPYGGGFRAPLAANWSASDLDKVVGVGLNTSGQVVKGAGNSGIKGALVLTKARKAGEIVDVMTDGEIVDFHKEGVPSAAKTIAAGTEYYAAAADGAVSTTNTGTYLGFTAEAGSDKGRLIVRAAR